MAYLYKTSGVCARDIRIECNDGVIENVEFNGGCNGNTKGIGALIKGMKIQDVIDRCEGIKCGFKNTSCPDQLAKALKLIQEQEQAEQ